MSHADATGQYFTCFAPRGFGRLNGMRRRTRTISETCRLSTQKPSRRLPMGVGEVLSSSWVSDTH